MKPKIEHACFITAVIITTMLNSVQGSWCLPTGPGTCNLNIEGTPVTPTGGGYKYVEVWTRINIFDHACNLIGYLKSPVAGVAIYSELPWAVVLTEIENDSRNFAFCYAGTCYDSGFTYNTFDIDASSTIECLRAFECDNELRTAKEGRSFERRTWNESAFD